MNRRANIEESGLNFSPSGISVPKADQSGEILMGGVQNFAKGLMEREDKADSVAAMAKYGDFNAAYSQGKADLQLKYKDNPKGYVQATKDLGSSLITQFSKDMQAGPAKKFREMTMSATAQDMDNVVGWSIKQDQDNILGGIQKSYGDVALGAEAEITPAGLKNSLGLLDKVHTTSSTFLSATSNRALKLETRKQAIDNSMNARILDNPALLNGDLQRGLYDEMLTPGEVKKYQKQAFDAQVNQVSRAQYEGFKATSVTMSETVEGIQNGAMSPGEISRMITAYKLHENEKYADGTPVVPEGVISGLESLRNLSLRNIPLPKIERDMTAKVALADFDTRWDAFQTDRTNRGSVKGAREEALLYAKLLNLYEAGTIPPDEFQKKKNIIDTKIASRAGKKVAGMPLKEAFQKAATTHPIFTFLNDDDLYTAGYTMITDQVDKDKTLTAAEKVKYKDQYFLTYLQEIEKYPPEKLNKAQNPEMIATSILHGEAGAPGLFKKMIVYKHPETGEPLIYGQTTTRNGQARTFLGLDEKGLPRWGTPKNTLAGFDNR